MYSIRTISAAGVAGLIFATTAQGQSLYDPATANQGTSGMEGPIGEAFHHGADHYEDCVTITFEGGGQGAPIGEVTGTGTTFGSGWFTLNSGPFLNNPSGTTVGVLFGTSSEAIVFDSPRSSVKTFFASAVTVTVEGVDANNASLGSSSMPANAPPFETWDQVTFDAGDNLISSIVFSGGANATIIDNFTSCVLYEELPVSCEGFGPPVGDEPITVNKNRALPLRAELIGVDGLPLTDADIVAPPVLQVLFSAVTSD